MFAQYVDPNYQTLDAGRFFAQDTVYQTLRGIFGGAIVGGYEFLEAIIVNWAKGDFDQGFDATRKMYASTLAVAKVYYAEKTPCRTLPLKFSLVSEEIFKRMENGQIAPQDPEFDSKFAEMMVAP